MEHESTGPTSVDYVRAVRRAWRRVAAGAVIGAVVLAGVTLASKGTSARYRTVYTVRAVDDRSVSQSLGLPGELLAGRTLTQEGARVKSAIEDEFDATIPDDVTVTVTVNEAAQALTVAGVGRPQDATDTAALAAARWVVEGRRAELAERLGAIETVQSQRLEELAKRLAEVDRALDAATDDAARRAAEVERLTVVDEQLVAQRTLLAVQQLTLRSTAGLTDPIRTTGPKRESSTSVVVVLIAGALLGALVVVAWVMFRMFSDRTVRSRRAIDAIRGVGFEGVLPTGPDATRADACTAIARRLSRVGGRLLVAGVDDAGVGGRVAAELARAAAGLSLVVVDTAPGVGLDGTAVIDVDAGDRLLLVACHGRTSREAADAAAAMARTSGVASTAFVIDAVPAGEVAAALGGQAVVKRS